MRDKIITYYWPWFKGLGITVLAVVFLRAFATFVEGGGIAIKGERLLHLLLFIGLCSIFIGGMYHFYNEAYRPWRKKGIFEKSLLKKVDLEGFHPDLENECLEGYFNGYYVTLNADTTSVKGDYIAINVFIDIRKSEVDLVVGEIKEYELMENSGYYWITHTEVLTMMGKFSMDKIREKLSDMTTRLEQKDIKPYIEKQ